MKVSNCCGALPRVILGPGSTPDNDTETFGICGECGDYCEYEEDDPILQEQLMENMNENTY